MTPLERAVAAMNNTARVQDIAGNQQGVLGTAPFYCVTNPNEVVRAVLEAIREPSEVMARAGTDALPAFEAPLQADASDCWQAMIDAALSE